MLLKLEYNDDYYVHAYVDLGFLYWNAKDILTLLPTNVSHTTSVLQVFFPNRHHFLRLGDLDNYSKEWGQPNQIVLTSNEAAFVASKSLHNKSLFPWMCKIFMRPLTKIEEDGETYITLRETVQDEQERKKSPLFFITQFGIHHLPKIIQRHQAFVEKYQKEDDGDDDDDDAIWSPVA